MTFGSQQQDTISKRTEDTGTWLLERAEYHEWQDGSENVLWCHGIRECRVVGVGSFTNYL